MSRRGENIYRRKDGRYEGRYVTGKTESGHTKFGYVYGRQYQEVRNELLKRKADQLKKTNATNVRGISLNRCMERWFEEELRGTVKVSSYQTYVSIYTRHIQSRLGNVMANQITPSIVQEFAEHLQEKGLAFSTIKGVYRLLSAGMRYAQEAGYIHKNPCRKLKMQAECPPIQRVLNRTEHKCVKKAAVSEGQMPVLVAMYTGMRLGEVCALKWSDIDWEAKTITVNRTVQRVRKSGGTMLYVGTPKSSKSHRVLPLPEILLNMLRELMLSSDSEYVFGVGRPAEPRTVQRRFQTMLNRIGISGVHFHTLRHSFATCLLHMGIDIKTVSTMLGHSSAKTTLDFYVHSSLENQRAAMYSFAAIS